MAYSTRLAGLTRPRLAAAGIALAAALAVAGCAYAPPPEAGYAPPPGPPPGYAPQAAAGAAYGPGPAYPAQGPAYSAQGPAYPAQGPAYPAQGPGYAAPGPAYGGPQAYGGGGVTRDVFIARRREIAQRKGRDPDRAAMFAARRFDRMDSDHDGILQPAERRAWREAHGRYQGGGQNWQQPPAQTQ